MGVLELTSTSVAVAVDADMEVDAAARVDDGAGGEEAVGVDAGWGALAEDDDIKCTALEDAGKMLEEGTAVNG